MLSATLTLLLLQQAPFSDEIAAFKETDLKHPPAQKQILFIGSSSFALWKDVARYFPSHSILNRGFGGSSLPDLIRYAPEIIFPYGPKKIVIYCGENDIANEPEISAQEVVSRFKTLYALIRKEMPSIPILYISMKPSPSRWQWRAKFKAGNKGIQAFLSTEPHATFLSVWDAMLGRDGTPKKSIYRKDELHMNAKGYRLWAPMIARWLDAK